jgi:hypothetical protein
MDIQYMDSINTIIDDVKDKDIEIMRVTIRNFFINNHHMFNNIDLSISICKTIIHKLPFTKCAQIAACVLISYNYESLRNNINTFTIIQRFAFTVGPPVFKEVPVVFENIHNRTCHPFTLELINNSSVINSYNMDEYQIEQYELTELLHTYNVYIVSMVRDIPYSNHHIADLLEIGTFYRIKRNISSVLFELLNSNDDRITTSIQFDINNNVDIDVINHIIDSGFNI